MLTSFFTDLFKFVLWMGVLIAVGLVIAYVGIFKTIVIGLLLLILCK